VFTFFELLCNLLANNQHGADPQTQPDSNSSKLLWIT